MWVRALAVAALSMLALRSFAVADQTLKPVEFTVVDLVTKKPVTEFSYALRVIVPGEVDRKQKQAKIKPIQVKSASGTFVVQVPVSCKLVLDLEAQDAVAGYQHTLGSIFTVLSTDPKRKFVAELELGHQVKGIVRDSETRLPIPRVKVVAAPFTEWHQWRGPFAANTPSRLTPAAGSRSAVSSSNGAFVPRTRIIDRNMGLATTQSSIGWRFHGRTQKSGGFHGGRNGTVERGAAGRVVHRRGWADSRA